VKEALYEIMTLYNRENDILCQPVADESKVEAISKEFNIAASKAQQVLVEKSRKFGLGIQW
jgi:hypothetical protein